MGKSKNKSYAAKQAPRRHARNAAKSAEVQEKDNAETAAQVREIEDRLQAVLQEVKGIESKMRMCAVEAKRAELMGRELDPLPEETKMYRQVGKIFLQQPKADLAVYLRATAALKSIESQQLEKARGKLEAKIKSEAVGLRELLGEKGMQEIFANGGRTAAIGTATFPGGAGADAVKGNALMPLYGSARAAGTAEGKAATDDPEAGADKSAGSSGIAGSSEPQ